MDSTAIWRACRSACGGVLVAALVLSLGLGAAFAQSEPSNTGSDVDKSPKEEKEEKEEKPCLLPMCMCAPGDDGCGQFYKMALMMAMSKPANKRDECQQTLFAMMGMTCPPKEKKKKKSSGGKKKEPKKKATECQAMGDGATRLSDLASEGRDIQADIDEAISGVGQDVTEEVTEFGDSEKQHHDTLSGKSWGCDTCEPLNHCVKSAAGQIKTLLETAESELDAVDSIAGGEGGEGEEEEEESSGGMDYQAGIDGIGEEEKLKGDLDALIGKLENREQCKQGVKDNGAKSDFDKLAQDQLSAQNEFKAKFAESWCTRHDCSMPDIGDFVSRVAKFGDTVSEFSAEVGGDISGAVSAAVSAFEEAQSKLDAPDGDESRDLFRGAIAFDDGLQALEDAQSGMQGRADDACQDAEGAQ